MIPRLRINFVSNLMYLFAAAIFGFLVTPFLIRELGIANYGLIAVTLSVVSYVSLVTAALNSSVGRHISQAYESNDMSSAQAYYSTSVIGAAIIFALLVAVVSIASGPILRFLAPNTQTTLEHQALLIATVLSLSTITVSSIIGIGTFITNRLEIKALIETIAIIARGTLIVCLVSWLFKNTYSVSVAYLAEAFLLLILHVRFTKRLLPELRISIGDFSARALQTLAAFSGWVTLNQLGSLLFLQTELILISRFSGLKDAGIYGALLMFSTTVRAFSRTFATSVAPSIIRHAGEGATKRMREMTAWSSNMTGMLVAIPVSILIAFNVDILEMWLGPEYAKYGLLLIILTFHLPANLTVLPLFSAQIALNKVRAPAYASVVIGLLNVFALFLVAYTAPGNLILIAAVGGATLAFKNLIFTVLHASKILSLEPRLIFFSVARSYIFMGVLISIGYLAKHILANPSRIATLAAIATQALIGCSFLYLRIRSSIQSVSEA